MFDYVLRLLRNNINGHPQEYRGEVEFAIEIFERGQGYLTKRETGRVEVIFFDNNASK